MGMVRRIVPGAAVAEIEPVNASVRPNWQPLSRVTSAKGQERKDRPQTVFRPAVEATGGANAKIVRRHMVRQGVEIRRLPTFAPPFGLGPCLAQLKHGRRQADRLGLVLAGRLNPAQGFLITRVIVPIPDDPDGRNRFCRIGLEDDAPVAVADHDLAPTSEAPPKRQPGGIPYVFQSKQLLEKSGRLPVFAYPTRSSNACPVNSTRTGI